MVLYNACVRMIERGNTEGLAEKLDLFYLMGRFTNEQYTTLVGMMQQ